MRQFMELLADAMEKESVEIEANDKFRNYDEWDSLAALSILAMINENYNITIPRKVFDTLMTVEDLYLKIKEVSEG